MEDIGARRLHTIMNTLLDEYLFDMPNPTLTSLKVTPKLVRAKMARVIESDDLARFIL
jgi:ATP-dependent HslUV protease ATP-binding subunit HslU